MHHIFIEKITTIKQKQKKNQKRSDILNNLERKCYHAITGEQIRCLSSNKPDDTELVPKQELNS
jgi:hypothetical protein